MPLFGKLYAVSIVAKCLRTLSGLFSPNLIVQSSCRILITHAKIRPILHDDWSIRLGENRLDKALKHLAATPMQYTVSMTFGWATLEIKQEQLTSAKKIIRICLPKELE